MSNYPTDAEKIDNVYNQRWKIYGEDKTNTFVGSYTSWVMSSVGTKCEFFEKQWVECAYQASGFSKKCADELDDYTECITGNKAFKRYSRMQEERQKRGLPYQNPPPVDALQVHKFKTAHF